MSPIFLLILGVIMAIFTFLSWRDQKLGLALLLASLPTYLMRLHIGPLPTTLLELLVLITIGVWLISIITKREARNMKHSGGARELLWTIHDSRYTFHIPIILLLIAATLGTFISPDKLSALGSWKAYFVEPIILFFVISTTIKTREEINRLLTALGASALVVSLLGVMQYLSGIGFPIPWDIERRVTSVFDFPNALGLFVGPIVTIGWVMLYSFYKERSWKRWFWFSIVLFGSLAIVLAKTEAAIVAIPASLLLISFFDKKLRRWTIPLTVIGFVAAMMIGPVREKLLLQDYSGDIRRGQWMETSQMLKDHPIFGAGLSGYPTVFAPYHQATWIEIFQYPHNIVLNIWTELGILGLIAFLILAIQTIRIVKDASMPRLYDSYPLSLLPISYPFILFVPLLEMTIHGLVDVPYFKNDLAILTWTLIALLVVSQKISAGIVFDKSGKI